ncbi:MAG: glycosyltransferase [Bacilli bacterium]
MKEKLSKLINVYKKYGFKGFCKKLRAYIIANYLDKISFKTIFNKRKYINEINDILLNNKYERIILWRSSFGYNVPLFQRPQHIANNLSKNGCLVFYEVTTMTDNVKIYKKYSDNLYLFNFNNKSLNKILTKCLSNINKPKYIQLYSTDWKLSIQNIEWYLNNGYKFIYEYIDHISPVLSGTKDLPKNISDKYEYVMNHKKNVYVVVTADNLKEDVINKRGKDNLIFSSNGVDYEFFQHIDKNFKLEKEFTKCLNKPCICYYGALASWVDYDLIKKINDLNKYNIVLFGIKYDESFDKSEIDKLKNVYFFGPRDYKVLKNYANKMDVMMIPFVLNDITASTNPLKLFEYMALGKPIITTDMIECRKYKSVLIGKNHEDFIKKIDIALTKKNDKKYIELLKKEAKENDWSNKAKVIIDYIKKDE